MDASFEILLPKRIDLHKIGFKTPSFEWQGIQYPQGNPEYSFGKNFKLKFPEHMRDIKYVKKHLPFAYTSIEWQVIEVSGEGLDIYSDSLFGFTTEEDSYGLWDLLNFLLEGSSIWIVIFEPQYDGFEKVINGKIEDILTELNRILNGEEEQGFLIFGYGSR